MKARRWIPALPVIAILSLGLGGCQTHSKEDFYNAQSAESIFHKGIHNLERSNFKSAIDDFEALESRYPFGEYGDKAQLGAMYGYFRSHEYASVLAAGERFLRVYPTHPHLDYVYYLMGMANVGDLHGQLAWLPMERDERDIDNAHQALGNFNTLINRFPNSQYAPNAAQHMVYLRNLLAEHELNAARYYYKRGAYLAAANRASGVVQDFDRAPQVIDALALMVKSYRKLALPKLAEDNLAILKKNYPEASAVLDELG